MTLLRADFGVELVRATRPAMGIPYGLVTFKVAVSRGIWTELLTHRRRGCNAASRRAMRGRTITEQHGAWMPSVFYGLVKGMGDSNVALSPDVQVLARLEWEQAIADSERHVLRLQELGVSKQDSNRLLTDAHITNGIVTMTEDGWRSFLLLRNHIDADRNMRELLALKVQEAIDSAPWVYSSLHLPFWPNELEGQVSYHEMRLIACARIARVSYGEAKAAQDDLTLAYRLMESKHASPFEHLATFKRKAKRSALNCLPGDRFDRMGWETLRAELGI